MSCKQGWQSSSTPPAGPAEPGRRGCGGGGTAELHENLVGIPPGHLLHASHPRARSRMYREESKHSSPAPLLYPPSGAGPQRAHSRVFGGSVRPPAPPRPCSVRLTGFWAAPANTRETAASIFLMECKQRRRRVQRLRVSRPPPSLLQAPRSRRHALNARRRDGVRTTSCAAPVRGPTRMAPSACPAHPKVLRPLTKYQHQKGWGCGLLWSPRGGRLRRQGPEGACVGKCRLPGGGTFSLLSAF